MDYCDRPVLSGLPDEQQRLVRQSDKENIASDTKPDSGSDAVHKASALAPLPRGDRNRRSLTSQEDMKKLREEYAGLQEQFQQYQQLPGGRRESLTGRSDDRTITDKAPPAAQPFAATFGAISRPPAAAKPQQQLVLGDTTITSELSSQQPSLQLSQQPSHQPSLHGSVLSHLLPHQPDSTGVGGNSNTNSFTATLSGSTAAGEVIFTFPPGLPASATGRAAIDVFEDPELSRLVEQGLSAQLTSSKAGADDKFRIAELAGIVKTLRRCVREMGSRASSYVERCMKIEREGGQQLEKVRLASECSVKGLEAELAGQQNSAAQYEASIAADRMAWGAQLDALQAEVNRLRREQQRLSEERDRARVDGEKAKQSCAVAESELKEVKRQAAQAAREALAAQSRLTQQAADDKAAGERRESDLLAESNKLTQRLAIVTECVGAQDVELATLRAVLERQAEALRSAEADAVQAKAAQQQMCVTHAKLQHEASLMHNRLQQETSVVQAELQQTISAMQAELQASQAKVPLLQEALDGSRAEAERLSGSLTDVSRKLADVEALGARERGEWAAERGEAAANLASSVEREAALQEEKVALKSAIQSALDQITLLTESAAELREQAVGLRHDNDNLRNQVEFVTGCQTTAEEHAEARRVELSQREALLEAMAADAKEKDARLAILEDEFDALKDVLGDAGGQKDVVQSLLRRIATLQGAVATAEATRRRLHNELVEAHGNIRVFCRVRPHAAPAIRCLPDSCSVVVTSDGRDHAFSFDHVFGPTSSQQDVFGTVAELVQSALDGYHVCLFSYGQTGSGKTHTMQGVPGHPQQQGIVPRAVEKILTSAARLEADLEWEYSLDASCIEVYNDKLRDLLGPSTSGYISDSSAIKHDVGGGHTTVAGVTRVALTDAQQAAELVRRAAAARNSQATAMNAESSRSHSVFMLYISGRHAPSGTLLQGCLCLVDLAGSERLDRSLVEDQRKKEACAINQSLSALGDVFGALSSRSQHVPYRNSKLTYLLQPCLGGHGKTLMFVNINPEPASCPESLCSLKFAAKVNGCETGAKGGAKRHVLTSAAGGTAAAAPPTFAMSAGGVDSKRQSLPGWHKAAGQQAAAQDPAALKRMSLACGPRLGGPSALGSSSVAAALAAANGGSKRVAAVAMPPIAASAAKRVKH